MAIALLGSSESTSGGASTDSFQLRRSFSAKIRQIVRCGSWSSSSWSSSRDCSGSSLQQQHKEVKKQQHRCPYSAIELHNPSVPYEFRMPLHYPRYTKAEYEQMPEWLLDRLLEEYGLPARSMGCLEGKREYAIGAFIWC